MKRTKISNNGLFTVASKWIDEEPIREELFSIERLEHYAATLAAEQQVSGGPGRGQQLLPRFAENGHWVIASYHTLAQAALRGQAVSPATEWLVDNFHLLEEQLRQIRQDLPPSYYYQLPKLSLSELRDYLRIYSLALKFVARTKSRFDGFVPAIAAGLSTDHAPDYRRTVSGANHLAADRLRATRRGRAPEILLSTKAGQHDVRVVLG